MKRLFVLLFLLLATPAFSANEWRNGDGSNTIPGTTNVSDIDAASYEDLAYPLDRLLAGYRESVKVSYASASSLTVSAGEVVCSNSGGTVRKMRRNTSSTTVTFSDLDTGVEASSTTYYLYAVADSDAETFTVKISASSTAPSGVTYFKKLGSFFNNSSSNVDNTQTVTNDNDYYGRELGAAESKSFGTNYQASTDGFVYGYVGAGGGASCKGYTDSTSTPTTQVVYASQGSTDDFEAVSFMFPVKKSYYYRVDITNQSGGSNASALYFIAND